MHAYLITGEGEDEALKLAARLKAKPIGFTLQKISDIRELANFTRLTLTEKTAVVVYDIDRASLETQNAFLKELEEPQPKLIYILTAKNSESVLPTIVSRCQVLETPDHKPNIVNKEKIQDFLKSDKGGQLATISKISKREEAIEFVTDLIYVSHKIMLKRPSLSPLVEAARDTLSALRANGNVQLQLTNLITKLPI